MKEFVAITDDVFYSHPEMLDKLVPFTHKVSCRHLLQQPLEIDGYADILDFAIVENDSIQHQMLA